MSAESTDLKNTDTYSDAGSEQKVENNNQYWVKTKGFPRKVYEFAGSNGTYRTDTIIVNQHMKSMIYDSVRVEDNQPCVTKFFTQKPWKVQTDPSGAKYSQLRAYVTELTSYIRLKGTTYTPKLFDFGKRNEGKKDEMPFIVIESLGNSILDYTHLCDYVRFTDYSALLTLKEMVECLKQVHSKKVVVCDIKLENFCMVNDPKEGEPKLKIIDFGVSQPFGCRSFQDLPEPNDKAFKHYYSFAGTYSYAPRAAHYGLPPCPYDDLEALLYSVVLLFGTWYELGWNMDAGWASDKMLREKHRFWTEQTICGPAPLRPMFRFFRSLNRSDPEIPYDELLALIQDSMDSCSEKDSEYPMVRFKNGKRHVVMPNRANKTL